MIKFRENWSKGHVEIFENDVFVAGFPEYSTTAKYTQARWNLSDAQLMDIYRDYKDDYDQD